LAYSKKELEKMNPLKDGLALPGWDRSYQKDELKRLLQEYQSVDEEKLFANLLYFLNGILPSAHQAGIRLAIHPDDPPWPIFSLPRIIRDEAHIDRLLKAVDVPENGITLCTGSLGASPQNDLVHLADKYSAMDRVPFLHLRNVLWTEEGFVETSEVGGSLDIPGIARVLVKNHWDGYVRSDHGRMIWGEKGRPGYGLYDRALSATYIEGLFNALEGKKGSL
jgi:mannonate dehydratase